MRLSQYFLPLLKETPKEAQIASHRLMLRAGMIQQSSAGIYSWLPLGKKVLDRIAQIVREEQKATLLEQQHAERWSRQLYEAFSAIDAAGLEARLGGAQLRRDGRGREREVHTSKLNPE